MKIKTVELQEMLDNAVKGVSNNKLIPLTSMLGIEVKDNKLTLISTDAVNYLYITKANINEEEFYAVVNADLFIKLVSKFTSEFVELEIQDDKVLNVKGNGSYILDLQFDESGNIVRFGNHFVNPVKMEYEVNSSVIQKVIATNKASLASTLEVPVYTAYYVSDRVLSTDTTVICELNSKVADEQILISKEFMDLMGLITDEKFSLSSDGKIIQAFSKEINIAGTLPDGIEDYQVDAIDSLLKQNFESSCLVDKNKLIDILSRIALFVGNYDNGAIRLVFTDDYLSIESLKTNGIETIKYSETNNPKPFKCLVDVNMLLNQINANISDKIIIQYGLDNAIKLISDDTIQVIALLEE